MDVAALRAAQAPLKARYRDDPATAVTPVRARATFAEPGVTCTVATAAGPVRAGLHAATGGTGADVCSGDMMMEALLACTGVTVRSVATAMRLEVRGAQLTADGVFDARGTLGLDRDVAVGVQGVVVTVELDTDADDAALERLATLTERYCVVAQSLRDTPRIVVRRRG
jgi:uncharacterized OsmC-like protein